MMRRLSSQMNCSPALAGLGMLIVIGAVIYVYRQVIMTTIITAVLAAVAVAVFTGAIAVTISTLRWYRRKSKELAVATVTIAAPDTWTKEEEEVTDADVAALSAEADDLASAGTELIFDNDGNLHARRS